MRTHRPLLFPAVLVAGALLGHARAAPTDGTSDPARARVAAQCVAFWEGAEAPARAAPYRALAIALSDPASTRTFIERTLPAMRRLSVDAGTEPRAAALWQRHATLCSETASPPAPHAPR